MTVTVDQVVTALRAALPEAALDVRSVPIQDVFITLPAAHLRRAAEILVEQLGVTHLSTVSGNDTGPEIELLYHFWDGRGITLRTLLPQQGTEIASLTDLIPGAAFYEREVGEMLHVTFVGHPDLRPLLLPDDWNGEAPLRKASDRQTPAGESEERT